MTSHTANAKSLATPSAGLARLWPALCAALLGVAILYGAGFAPLAAHNAAHDARHSAAFPCH